MNKRVTIITCVFAFISPLSHAINFNDTCVDNGGFFFTDVTLSDISANTAQQDTGVILKSTTGQEWRIADEFGNSDIFREQIRVARMAQRLGLEVNICGGRFFVPRRVWAIEVRR
ncbi:hypothetical protein ACOMICROBIO_LMKGKHOH_03945 [Vibrio sp. B1FIG11]|uniref:hypothetical protein n=1 Tax=Vibrio sp. B1FIG11 TaxID=2751177 RepID=UPI001AFC379C|nr:hypothetical protein [Vibrio sp. B1FIG11]CAD7826920.1 hypothetical protein ACOMICROBIO_LMKGKHOH_03945 [Vibrio sp. B1FIG11]CAE6962139.1 hypothetical protein ACOMICROBIO_LMKGKHOH_03945 [Vibrio sp. B1FIG11]